MFENMEQLREEVLLLATQYGIKVVGAVLVLIAGWLTSRWVARQITRACQESESFDKTIIPLLSKIGRLAVLAVTLVVVLNQFGFEATSLVALLGAAGLTIGLALQGALSNVAAGLMLLTFRPFEVGETAEIGGTRMVIDELGLMMTCGHTPDNVYVAVPNSSVWGREIRNFTRNPQRRIDMVFGIGYEDDIDRAMELIRQELQSDQRVLEQPAPLVAVGNLGDSSVDLFVRPWVAQQDYLAVSLNLTERIKKSFDKNGISIPFPQRDVHLYPAASEAS